jgi:exodeoxyribonuclease VII small subunit
MNAPSSYDPSTAPDVETLSYEQAFEELENIIAALESNEHSLNFSMALFERGQCLARHCAGLLEAAELKVQQLSGGELYDFDPPA